MVTTDELIYTKIEKLISKCKSKDSKSFDELYNLTNHKVYYLALNITKDRLLAEDIVQDVFIIAFNYIDTLQNPRLFLAWLNKITYNECLKEINRKNRFNIIDSEIIFPFIQDHNIDNLPLDSYLNKENSNEMLDLLHKLPDIHSSVLIMRYYKDMKLAEISHKLNISEGTVKSRISNAKKGLLNLCIEYGDSDFMFKLSNYSSFNKDNKNRKISDSTNNNICDESIISNIFINDSSPHISSTDNLILSLNVDLLSNKPLPNANFIRIYNENTSSINLISNNDLKSYISHIKFKDIYEKYIDISHEITNYYINIITEDLFYNVSYMELYDLYDNVTTYVVRHSYNLDSKA